MPLEDSTKREHIGNLLKDIEKKSILNYKKYKNLKKLNSVLKISSSILNTVSVTSIIISIGPQMPVFMIVSLCSSSLSALISAGERASNIDFKIMRYNTTYNQYSDLYRDIKMTLKRNNLESSDLDLLISDINKRISLIQDSEE